jgi:hypothetical protein
LSHAVYCPRGLPPESKHIQKEGRVSRLVSSGLTAPRLLKELAQESLGPRMHLAQAALGSVNTQNRP